MSLLYSDEPEDEPIDRTYDSGGVVNVLKLIWNGPRETRDPQVTLVYPRLQQYPKRLRKTLKRNYKPLIVLFLIVWVIADIIIAKNGILATMCQSQQEDPGREDIKVLDCGQNSNIWIGPNEKCGLNAKKCWDINEDLQRTLVGTTLKFKCPSNCQRNSWTYIPWAVGNESILHDSVVIGGPDVYRGDSFICAAALHAGKISRYSGGCGTLEWVGSTREFTSTMSTDSRFSSYGFDSEFPQNFRFLDPPHVSHCEDISGITILINSLFFMVAAYLLDSPPIFLAVMSMFGFWYVMLVNPPWRGGNAELNSEFISAAVKRLLPCALGMIFIYKFAVEALLTDMPASLSRALFWGGGFLLGINENIVFGSLPIDRLIVSDLNSQPGAWLCLIIIFAIVLVIFISQAYTLWISGKLKLYLKCYLTIFGILIALSFFPGQTLRIHHYFLALVLLPGTALQTTPSLLYQGLLVGLYIAGVARWDFDSILQTLDQLSRGDSLSSKYDPAFVDPLVSATDVVLQWKSQFDSQINGFSLIINDIERARIPIKKEQPLYAFNLTDWITQNWPDETVRPLKWYVRVAAATFRGDFERCGKFSSPIVINADDTYQI